MRRFFVFLLTFLMVLSAVAPVMAAESPRQVTITWYAKYVTPDGMDTRPLPGYVQWATMSAFNGLGKWQYCWIDARGQCSITVPVAQLCWTGPGWQWCYAEVATYISWTMVPWQFGACSVYDPPTVGGIPANMGIVKISHPGDVHIGLIWQGDCAR